MTTQEKLQIQALRAAGLSYQAIADKTGMTLGSIKMYFKRHSGSPAQPCCEQCHKPLRQDLIRARRFCSDACRYRWRAEHPRNSFTCLCCGKTFSSRKPRKYCS